MNLHQREVPEYQPQPAVVGVDEMMNQRLGLDAGGAFVVAVIQQRQLRVCVTEHMVSSRQRGLGNLDHAASFMWPPLQAWPAG